jgi:micrococcal nuclease
LIRAAVAALALSLAASPAGAPPAVALERCSATDGDSLRCSFGPVRVLGLDTPEIRGKCPAEKALARIAKERLEQLIAGGVTLERKGRNIDKYGRFLRVTYDADGHDVALVLISEGLARAYDGRGKRLSWCVPGAGR